MRDALERSDIETFFEVLGERGTLLDSIFAHERPFDLGADWEEMASALSLQNHALREAAESQRERMQRAIVRIEQVKEAQRSYHQLNEPSGILNENLRV